MSCKVFKTSDGVRIGRQRPFRVAIYEGLPIPFDHEQFEEIQMNEWGFWDDELHPILTLTGNLVNRCREAAYVYWCDLMADLHSGRLRTKDAMMKIEDCQRYAEMCLNWRK